MIILAAPGLDDLIKQGKVDANSRVDLVRSLIGMAVRTGAPKPDISTADAFTRTLLQAKSIGYSDSASGVYLRTVLFPRLARHSYLVPWEDVTRFDRPRIEIGRRASDLSNIVDDDRGGG